MTPVSFNFLDTEKGTRKQLVRIAYMGESGY